MSANTPRDDVDQTPEKPVPPPVTPDGKPKKAKANGAGEATPPDPATKPNGEGDADPASEAAHLPNDEDASPDAVAQTASAKKAKAKAKAKAYKPPTDSSGDTTLERAESLPDEAAAAPELPPLQETVDLDDMLSSAIAPDDEDVDLSEMELGPPHYPALPRRTSPPQMVPIRIFPKGVGSTTVYMLQVKREAQGEGDLDTYLVVELVRLALKGHPTFQKAIKRFQICLGVTSLGKPFFLEVNLDDPGIWGQSRRDLVVVAESKWVIVGSDRQSGYLHWDADHFDDPVTLAQSFEELYKLTYKPCVITTLNHPIIQRGQLRKTGKK